MALYDGDQREDARECPVCYECLSGTERTLSCGHVFCHDCLVKTLVTISSDGNIKGAITCPVCRHLTFIKRQREALVSLAASKDSWQVQTLQVPLRRSSALHRAAHYFRRMSERIRRQRLISPDHDASQIFVISAQGRPMAEEDALGAGTTLIQPHRRRRRRICTTARCLVLLLSVFTLVALVAATLPWVLLA